MYIILIMLDGLGRYIRSLETGKSRFIIHKVIFKPTYTAFVRIKALSACYIFNFDTNRCTFLFGRSRNLNWIFNIIIFIHLKTLYIYVYIYTYIIII